MVAVLQLVGTSAGSPRIDQPYSMDSVAAKQRMPSTSKTNAVSANAAYQQSRKLKLSSEYHESRSPSRRSVPSQMQRHKSVSASSAHQEGLAAMYHPKATPPPLHAMQVSHPLRPTHRPLSRASSPRPRTLMDLPSHRARPQVLVYGVPGPDRKQAAAHDAARRGIGREDTARRRALNASHIAATYTGLPLYEPPPCSPTGGGRRLAAFQQTNKTNQPRRSSVGVERVLRSVRACPDGTPAWDLITSLTPSLTRPTKPSGMVGVPAEIIAKAAMAAYRPGPHRGLPAAHLGLHWDGSAEENNAIVDEDAWVVF